MGIARFGLGTAFAGVLALVPILLVSDSAPAQEIPRTAGETLSGKSIVLADEVRGHTVVLVAGFSREGGNGAGALVKSIHADAALNGVAVYEIAQLAGAPSLIRGMIKSGMRKGVPSAEQNNFVVLTQDEKPWRAYFEVSDDQVPYVVLIDATGKVLWRGHGQAAELEPLLRASLPR
ncbi:MAG TPA: hypothetical protein VFD98_10690 [Terracidiphilus sp.]|nr:hypothetical protein [Terracidiphilus sp.]